MDRESGKRHGSAFSLRWNEKKGEKRNRSRVKSDFCGGHGLSAWILRSKTARVVRQRVSGWLLEWRKYLTPGECPLLQSVRSTRTFRVCFSALTVSILSTTYPVALLLCTNSDTTVRASFASIGPKLSEKQS